MAVPSPYPFTVSPYNVGTCGDTGNLTAAHSEQETEKVPCTSYTAGSVNKAAPKHRVVPHEGHRER